MLQIKHGEGSAVAKFLDHRRNHHGTEADRVSGNHKESELEGQAHADEAVVKGGVGDRRRIFFARSEQT